MGRCVMLSCAGLALAAAVGCRAPGRAAAPDAVLAVSPRHLVVRTGDERPPPAAASAWRLSSLDVPGLEAGVRPVAATRKSWAAELLPRGWPFPAVRAHEVVLELAEPLRPGTRYTLEGGPLAWSWTFDPETAWTPALKVNQVGYRPDAPRKYAYASYWTSEVAPIPVRGGRWRVVREPDGRPVLEGAFVRHFEGGSDADDAYGNDYGLVDVWEADLRDLVEPGSYHVEWEGVGRSWSFEVAEDVYWAPFRTTVRAIFHQRCGTALPPSTTAWSRGACHLRPARLTTLDGNVVGADPFTALPASATGEVVRATGGHHDAGDYDRHVGHLAIVDTAVDLYEIDPERFGGEGLGLPESGNGLPDVLDEALWALGLYAALQTADGGVPAGIETTGYPGWGVLPEDDDRSTWYAYAADPISSYRFAAASAKMARALRAFDPDGAAEWLRRARRAWEWAESHPRPYGAQGADVGAAAEMFKSTGEPAFERAFRDRGPFAGGNLAASPSDEDPSLPLEALWAHATTPGADPALRAASLRVIRERAESWIRWAERSAFRLAKSPWAPVGYGSISTPRDAGLLFRAHHLTGDERFRAYGLLACDVALGGNWSGWSWVTGLGDQPVRHPLSNPSLGDALDDPVPGIPVYGPSRLTESDGIHGAVIAAWDPPVGRWPMAERFADVSYVPVLNEYTVGDGIALTAFAFGYVAVPPAARGGDGG